MTTETLEIVGYFSFDCQPDGYCTYGCGKRPITICTDCMEHQMFVTGETLPDNAHPIFQGVDEWDENHVWQDVCDWCEETF